MRLALALALIVGLSACGPTRSTNLCAVPSRNGEALEVFARGERNVLYHKTLVGLYGQATKWRSTAWQALDSGVPLTSHPAAAAMADGTIVVLARGRDNRLHGAYELEPSDAAESTMQAARWSAWEEVGGSAPMASMPVVGQLADKRLVVLSVNPDGEVQYLVQMAPNQFSFSEWRVLGKLGLPVKGLPELVVTPEGDVSVFAVGEDANIYTASVTPTYVWTPWRLFSDAGRTHNGPDEEHEGGASEGITKVRAASTPGGRLSLFAFDDRNVLRQSFQRLRDSRYWTPWQRFVPRMEDTPHLLGVAVARDETTELLAVVARSATNTLYTRSQDRNTGWTNWVKLGGHVKRDPYLVAEPSSGVHLLAVGLDGVPVHMALTKEGRTPWMLLDGIHCD